MNLLINRVNWLRVLGQLTKSINGNPQWWWASPLLLEWNQVVDRNGPHFVIGPLCSYLVLVLFDWHGKPLV